MILMNLFLLLLIFGLYLRGLVKIIWVLIFLGPIRVVDFSPTLEHAVWMPMVQSYQIGLRFRWVYYLIHHGPIKFFAHEAHRVNTMYRVNDECKAAERCMSIIQFKVVPKILKYNGDVTVKNGVKNKSRW